MTTIPMLHPLSGVRLVNPVLGVDLSSKRASGCVLAAGAAPAWTSKTIREIEHLGNWARMATDDIGDWLEKIEADHGLPGAVGIELPFAGPNTPPITLWAVGCFLVAVGDVYGARVPVVQWVAGGWKKLATGSGYAPGLAQSASKGQKRKAEKARLGAWARDVMGYTGTVEDEQDATGVAVATALKVYRR